jgi:4'-phosphopantetheinyl transferase
MKRWTDIASARKGETGMRADLGGLLPGTLHLWTCVMDEPDGATLARRLCAILSPDECERSLRLRHAADRHRFVASHAFVRLALSRHCAVEASRWRFDRTAKGKPFVAAPNLPQTPAFSLSYTEGMAACLIGLSTEIGVDVERLKYHSDLPRFAPSILAAGELQSLRGQYGANWTTRFYQLWTLKEAYAKARGVGLGLKLSDIAFEFAADGAIRGNFVVDLRDGPSNWFFRSHRPSPAHVLSLAAPEPSEILIRSFAFEFASDFVLPLT